MVLSQATRMAIFSSFLKVRFVDRATGSMLSFTSTFWSPERVLVRLVNFTFLGFRLSRPTVMNFTPSNCQGPESQKA